jgi:hypothetical protein
MVLGIDNLGEFSGGIFPMLKNFNAGESKNTVFAILYIVNVVIWWGGATQEGARLGCGVALLPQAAARAAASPCWSPARRFAPPAAAADSPPALPPSLPPAPRGLAGLGGWVVLGLAIAAYRRGDTPRRDYEQRYGPTGPTV